MLIIQSFAAWIEDLNCKVDLVTVVWCMLKGGKNVSLEHTLYTYCNFKWYGLVGLFNFNGRLEVGRIIADGN